MKTETKKYTFQTIVAPAHIRAQFTDLRKDLNTSDKQLMEALWLIASENLDRVAAEVTKLKVQAAASKPVKEKAVKAPKAPKAEKADALSKGEATSLSKAAKPKAKRQSKPSKEVVKTLTAPDESNVGGDNDDFECMVVDGTAAE